MDFKVLTSKSQKLLNEMVSSPISATVLVCDKLKEASSGDRREIMGMLEELKEKGYIKIYWANNEPYLVEINDDARNYEKLYAEDNKGRKSGSVSISIGNGNKIKNSTIGNAIEGTADKKGFYEKHPVICGFIISFVVGIILLFHFWEKLIGMIENMFIR